MGNTANRAGRGGLKDDNGLEGQKKGGSMREIPSHNNDYATRRTGGHV